MDKKASKEDRTVIMSDKYLSESGVQGGKVVAENLSLISFIVGIPLLIIGLYSLLNISLGWGFPNNMAVAIGVLLVLAIGILMTLGGYTIYRSKNGKT